MGNLVFQAALGGQVALSGPNTASSYTITVPTVTGTMITTGDTGTVTNTMLVNSTISGVALGSSLFNLTAGTGISFSTGTTYNGSAAITINGTSAQVYPAAGIANSTGTAWGTSYSTTGSGTVVALATSPTFVTPILGTPTSGTLTNTTGFPAANLAGTALPSAIVTSSLTALGTIATGVWNGTTIGIAYGGTGQTTYTNGQLLIGNTTGNTLTKTTLTAGSGITITNGSGAITIASSGGASAATPTVLGTVYASTLDLSGNATTAVGYQACRVDVGSSNTAFGATSLYTNTSGARNVAVGYIALYTNNGTENVGIGVSALQLNTSGNNNTAVGYKALQANTTASSNVAVGYEALVSNTTGANNVGVGQSALYYNATASYNTAIGHSAGTRIGGDYNTAIGALTIQATSSTGISNAAIGANALNALTSGVSNAGCGYASLYYITTGNNNTAMGHTAGAGVTTGSSNTFVGQTAGYTGSNNLTTGSNNIYVGIASPSVNSVTYEIVIGNGTTGKGGSTAFISPAGGGVYQGNNSSTWSQTSDQRLKKNIVDNTVGLSVINGIQVRNFEYRTEDEITELPKNQAMKITGVQLGAIAQELQLVLPDCVKTESTGVMSVDTTNITWHLINAVKELNAKITALEARVGA